MDWPENPVQWNLSRLWPLPVKSPAQSLDYRANSYHIHLSTLELHGYGKEISQICPCPFCPINSSLSGTPSPSHHSTAPASISLAAAPFEDSKKSSKNSLHQPQSPRSSSSRGDGHQLCCSRGQFITLPLVLLPYPWSSVIYFTEHSSSFSFVLLFILKNL